MGVAIELRCADGLGASSAAVVPAVPGVLLGCSGYLCLPNSILAAAHEERLIVPPASAGAGVARADSTRDPGTSNSAPAAIGVVCFGTYGGAGDSREPGTANYVGLAHLCFMLRKGIGCGDLGLATLAS